MNETIKVVNIVVFLSSGQPLVYENVHLEESFLLTLFRAHNNHEVLFVTADKKTISETKEIIAIDFSSPHVVGMRVVIKNTYTSTSSTD